MIENASARGELEPFGSRRILERTGGNLGAGLAFEAARYGIGVDLVIGRSFAPVNRALCVAFGARLVGEDLLDAGMDPPEVVEHLLERHGDKYFFTDQFTNCANLEAHITETGPEFAGQLSAATAIDGRRLILVKGAGTGASFTRIATALRTVDPAPECILTMPVGCNMDTNEFVEHSLEGLAVKMIPPFLDRFLVDRTVWVSKEDARRGQRLLAAEVGFFPGMSSGANYVVARRVAAERPDAIVATIIHDKGESYLAIQITEEKAA